MKSHCYRNNGPSGPDPTNFSASAASASIDPQLVSAPTQICDPGTPEPLTIRFCANVTAAGRRCRMLTVGDSELCPHHARPRAKRLQEQQDAEKLAAELLGPVQDFNTPGNVHYVLGNLTKQLAQKRIHRRDALALGYLCQLLLSSFGEYRKRAGGRRIRF
jgi:hypothetical protein